MNIGDKITIKGVEFTVWLIEDNIYHIKDDSNNGYCGDLEWLLNIKD